MACALHNRINIVRCHLPDYLFIFINGAALVHPLGHIPWPQASACGWKGIPCFPMISSKFISLRILGMHRSMCKKHIGMTFTTQVYKNRLVYRPM